MSGFSRWVLGLAVLSGCGTATPREAQLERDLSDARDRIRDLQGQLETAKRPSESASPAAAPAHTAPAGPDANALIDLNVKDQPLRSVVEYVQIHSGANILFKPNADGVSVDSSCPTTVSAIVFHRMPWREALQRIAVAADCSLRQDGEAWILSPHRFFTLSAGSHDVRKTMASVARHCAVEIRISEGVPPDAMTKKPSDEEDESAPRWIIRDVARRAGLVAFQDGSAGDWLVMSAGEADAKLVERVYPLEHLRPFQVYRGGAKGHATYLLFSRKQNSYGDLLKAARGLITPASNGGSLGSLSVEARRIGPTMAGQRGADEFIDSHPIKRFPFRIRARLLPADHEDLATLLQWLDRPARR